MGIGYGAEFGSSMDTWTLVVENGAENWKIGGWIGFSFGGRYVYIQQILF